MPICLTCPRSCPLHLGQAIDYLKGVQPEDNFCWQMSMVAWTKQTSKTCELFFDEALCESESTQWPAKASLTVLCTLEGMQSQIA